MERLKDREIFEEVRLLDGTTTSQLTKINLTNFSVEVLESRERFSEEYTQICRRLEILGDENCGL